MPTNQAAYSVGEFRSSGLLEFKIQEYTLMGTRWQKDNEKDIE